MSDRDTKAQFGSSISQLAEQPSRLALLPSSHCSPGSWVSSPQKENPVEIEPELFPVLESVEPELSSVKLLVTESPDSVLGSQSQVKITEPLSPEPIPKIS